LFGGLTMLKTVIKSNTSNFKVNCSITFELFLVFNNIRPTTDNSNKYKVFVALNFKMMCLWIYLNYHNRGSIALQIALIAWVLFTWGVIYFSSDKTQLNLPIFLGLWLTTLENNSQSLLICKFNWLGDSLHISSLIVSAK
jgi:hypothetical protein